jgi:hypothetical protein
MHACDCQRIHSLPWSSPRSYSHARYTADGHGVDRGCQSQCHYTEYDRATSPTIVGRMLTILPHHMYTRFADHPVATPILDPRTRTDLRAWSAYYDPSSQLICQMLSPSATAPPGSATSWYYGEITHKRRFCAVSTRNKPFQDSRPPPDALPITVLRETPTLLRCSLPPTPPDSVLDSIRSPICFVLK